MKEENMARIGWEINNKEICVRFYLLFICGQSIPGCEEDYIIEGSDDLRQFSGHAMAAHKYDFHTYKEIFS